MIKEIIEPTEPTITTVYGTEHDAKESTTAMIDGVTFQFVLTETGIYYKKPVEDRWKDVLPTNEVPKKVLEDLGLNEDE